MDDISDPWDWDTARVVQEFCTENRTWRPSTDHPKLPDPVHLKHILQENEIDGEALLGSASEAADFYLDLGIKVVKHKATIRSAIAQFRRRSRKYKIWKLRQQEEDEEDEDYIGATGQLGEPNRNEKLKEERKDHSRGSAHSTLLESFPQPVAPAALHQAAVPTVSAPIAPQTPAVSALVTAAAASLVTNDKPAEYTATSEEPVRKKRRVAPTTLSTEVGIGGLRNIPQGNLVSELELEEASDELLGAYLGLTVLNRADIADFEDSAQPLTNKDLEFAFQQRSYPTGLRRQRARLVKRRFAKREHVFRPAKADMVPGAHDPEHYEVLPAYGESDDEYDSETWEEIQKEEEHLKNFPEKTRSDLSTGEKKSLIEQIIAEKVAAWQTGKLPAFEHRANRIWNESHRQGLKHAIDRANRLMLQYQKRLDNYRSEIVHQQWSSETDMRKVEGVLDQTIFDLQYSNWVLHLLRSPLEPQKLPRVPRQRQPKSQRDDLAVASDEEILTSETESDDAELGDFIVHDESEIRAEVMINDRADEATEKTVRWVQKSGSGPVEVVAIKERDVEDVLMADDDPSLSEHADPASGKKPSAKRLPESSAVQNIASGQLDSNRVIIMDDDAKIVSKNKDRITIDQEEVLDLTQPEARVKLEKKSPSKVNGILQSKKNQVIIDLVTPNRVTAPAKHAPKLRLSFSPSNLLQLSDVQKKNFTENQLSVLDMIKNLDEAHVSALFTLAQWSLGDLWKGFVLPALNADSLPKIPLKSKEDKDTFYGLQFARLFDTFLTGQRRLLRRWFASQEDRAILEDRENEFPGFVNFLRELSLSYKISTVPREPPLSDASATKATSTMTKVSGGTDTDFDEGLDESSEDESASKSKNKKRKPTIVRNQQAMSLRESDRRRVQEQEERRRAMRAKLAMSNTTASQNMRFIINETKEDEQGFIYVPENIAGRIKSHQVSGVRFMWNQIVVNAQDRQGCLLAHTMGLGKTMQIITLLMTIAAAATSEDPTVSSQIPDDLKESRTLILAPSGLVNNWEDELLMWTDGADHRLGEFYKIDSNYSLEARHEIIKDWADHGGVLVIGYDLFKRTLTIASLQSELLDSPNLIVADEAHMMKNPKSKLHEGTGRFRSHLRIALTGSPLANKVLEYHSMINWVAPNYLSDLREFRHDYAAPIEEGLSVGASSYERRRALTRLRSLKETVAPKVHRRTIHSLKEELPQKTEFVISVPLTELQRRAYEMYMNFHYSISSSAAGFATLQVLALLCNHPACFRKRLIQVKKGEAMEDGSAHTALPAQLVSDELQIIPHKGIDGAEAEAHSWKIPLLNKILEESQAQNDSVLIFSQSIPTLDYLERVLKRKGRLAFRLDGKTRIEYRQSLVKDFNNNSECGVFLISTTAGGLGLNITGANRVIIFDFKYNPQHEQQAVGRAYRLGQTKPVFVYRFICGGTFEEKMQNKGIFKVQLASRVVDEKNPIPKAQRFEEMFAMPVEPVQQDLKPFIGKDKVLDAVLQSDVAKGIRSIVMADTFEEENLEEEQLTSEEALEAKRLIEMHQARLTGKPNVGFPLASAPGRRLSLTVSASVPGTVHASNAGKTTTTHDGTRQRQMESTPSKEKNLQGAPHPSFQPGTVEPVLGSTTQIRDTATHSILSDKALRFWDNAGIFRGELSRSLINGETERSMVDKKKEVAHQIVSAFKKQVNQRDRHELAQAKAVLVEAAESSPRFVEAIMIGKYPPLQIASLTGEAIRGLTSQLALLTAEDWAKEVGKTLNNANMSKRPASPSKQVSEFDESDSLDPTGISSMQRQAWTQTEGLPVIQPEQQNVTRSPLHSNKESSDNTQRKSHKDDDQAVLLELQARKEARNKVQRLPNWAKQAVASQGRTVPSSSTSPTPSATPATAPVRRAKNPFL